MRTMMRQSGGRAGAARRLTRAAGLALCLAAAPHAMPGSAPRALAAGEDGGAEPGTPTARPLLAGQRPGARQAPEGAGTPRLEGARRPGQRDGGATRRRQAAPGAGTAGERLPTGLAPAGAGQAGAAPPEDRETAPADAPRREGSLLDALPFPVFLPDDRPAPRPGDGPVTRRPGETPAPGRDGPESKPAPGAEAGRVTLFPGVALPTAAELKALGVPAFPVPVWLTPWRLGLIVLALMLVSLLSGRLARRRDGRRRRPPTARHRRDPDDPLQDPPAPPGHRGLASAEAMAGGGPRGD